LNHFFLAWLSINSEMIWSIPFAKWVSIMLRYSSKLALLPPKIYFIITSIACFYFKAKTFLNDSLLSFELCWPFQWFFNFRNTSSNLTLFHLNSLPSILMMTFIQINVIEVISFRVPGKSFIFLTFKRLSNYTWINWFFIIKFLINLSDFLFSCNLFHFQQIVLMINFSFTPLAKVEMRTVETLISDSNNRIG